MAFYLYGTVKNDLAAVVAGADVTLEGCSTVQTNSSGQYKVDLMTGPAKMDADIRKSFHTPVNKPDIQIDDGGTLQDIILPRCGNVYGNVYNHDNGNKIYWCKVTANSPGSPYVHTDVNGNYSIDLPLGTWSLTFEKVGFATRTRTGITSQYQVSNEENMGLYPN